MALSAASTMNQSEDIARVIAQYLSDQYLNTAGLSRGWRTAFGRLSRITRGIDMHATPDQLVSHLQLGYDSKSFGKGACDMAASMGRADLLGAAYGSGSAQMFPSACEMAAKNGRLECLKYLRLVAACPWNSKTLHAAVLGEHMNVVVFAIEHGCPSDNATLLYASGRLDVEMVCYLLEHGHKMTASFLSAAVWAGEGGIEIINLALHRGYNHHEAFSVGIDSGNLSLLKQLDEIGYPWHRDSVMKSVRRDTVDPEIVEWLRAQCYI